MGLEMIMGERIKNPPKGKFGDIGDSCRHFANNNKFFGTIIFELVLQNLVYKDSVSSSSWPH